MKKDEDVAAEDVPIAADGHDIDLARFDDPWWTTQRAQACLLRAWGVKRVETAQTVKMSVHSLKSLECKHQFEAAKRDVVRQQLAAWALRQQEDQKLVDQARSLLMQSIQQAAADPESVSTRDMIGLVNAAARFCPTAGSPAVTLAGLVEPDSLPTDAEEAVESAVDDGPQAQPREAREEYHSVSTAPDAAQPCSEDGSTVSPAIQDDANLDRSMVPPLLGDLEGWEL